VKLTILNIHLSKYYTRFLLNGWRWSREHNTCLGGEHKLLCFLSRTNDFLNRTNDFLNRTNDFLNRTNDFLNLTNDFLNRTNDFLNRTNDFLYFFWWSNWHEYAIVIKETNTSWKSLTIYIKYKSAVFTQYILEYQITLHRKESKAVQFIECTQKIN
jgi:hypothetical protein